MVALFTSEWNHYPSVSLSILSLPISNVGFLYLPLLQMINFIQEQENSQRLSLHYTVVMRFLPFQVDVMRCLKKHNQNHNHTVINEGLRLKGTHYYTL